MNQLGWRYTLASVEGTSHCRSGTACQDHCACCILYDVNGSPIIVAVASDGAGSATHSQAGAEFTCSLFLTELEAHFENGGSVADITREFLKRWATYLHHQIDARASACGLTRRDFACTILAAIVGAESAVFFQVGDGAIVVPSPENPDDFCWVFWPQKGEYENLTTFITDERAIESLETAFYGHRLDEVALFTDGLQRVTLDFQSYTAHSPFFRSMFAPLRNMPPGHAETLSSTLAAYLNSPKINERTDDDKTLILVSRPNELGETELRVEDDGDQAEQQSLL